VIVRMTITGVLASMVSWLQNELDTVELVPGGPPLDQG